MTPCCAGGLPIWWLVAEEVLLDSYLGLSSKLRAEGTELTTPMSWCCTKSLPCCTARRTCKRWGEFRLPTSTNIPESSSRFRSFASTWCIGLSIWISVKTWCQTWCTWVPIEVRCGMIVFCRKKHQFVFSFSSKASCSSVQPASKTSNASPSPSQAQLKAFIFKVMLRKKVQFSHFLSQQGGLWYIIT